MGPHDNNKGKPSLSEGTLGVPPEANSRAGLRPGRRPVVRETVNLVGQLLVAAPLMPDQRLARSVIYICSHGPEGTMGLVINRLMGTADFHELMQQLDIKVTGDVRGCRVHFGGPVEGSRGFVLHSDDYAHESTTMCDSGIAMTSTMDVLRAIASGEGPRQRLMALGYAGWQPGQLESEIHANNWLLIPADADIVFDTLIEDKWDRAIGKLGFSPSMLSPVAGRA